MGQSRPLFVYFHSFLVTISIQIEKSIDGVLGIRTRGRRMVGADKTTELWRPLLNHCFMGGHSSVDSSGPTVLSSWSHGFEYQVRHLSFKLYTIFEYQSNNLPRLLNDLINTFLPNCLWIVKINIKLKKKLAKLLFLILWWACSVRLIGTPIYQTIRLSNFAKATQDLQKPVLSNSCI